MLDACEQYMGDNKVYSLGAIKYLTKLKNHYPRGLMCYIERWVYSSRVKYAVFANRHLQTHLGGWMSGLALLYQARNQFATFDTNVWHGVIRELGWANANHPYFVEMRKEHVSCVLDVGGVCGKCMKYTLTVETDGTYACVHFERPKNACKTQWTFRPCTFGIQRCRHADRPG